jgi:hypothetical protein
MKHLEKFKTFENMRFSDYLNKRTLKTLNLLSPVRIKGDFSEEGFWNNAYSERELRNYCIDNELDDSFINQIDSYERDEYNDKIEAYIEDVYNGKHWDFYEDIIPYGYPGDYLSGRTSEDMYEIIKSDFNGSELEQHFDDFHIQSIRLVGDDFYDGEFLEIEIKTVEELDNDKIQKIKDYLEGQFSDGWGEGFEQRSHENWFIHTWDSDYFEFKDL